MINVFYFLLGIFYLLFFLESLNRFVVFWLSSTNQVSIWILDNANYIWYSYVGLSVMTGIVWLSKDRRISTLLIGLSMPFLVFGSRIVVGLFLASPTPWFPDPTKFHAEIAAVFFGMASLGLSIYFFIKSKNTKWNQGTENESAN